MNRRRSDRRAGVRRVPWAVVGLALGSMLLTLVVAEIWFPRLSGDNDEATYLQQAVALSEGDLAIPAGDTSGLFRPWLTGEHDDHLVFPFTTSYPLFLAGVRAVFGSFAASRAIVSVGLVGVSYWFFLRLLPSRRTTLVATAIVALSPFTVVQAALFLPYGFALGFGVAALAALLEYERRLRARHLVLAGLCLGVAFWTRPFDGILYGLCAAAIVLVPASTAASVRSVPLLRRILIIAAGAAPVVAATAATNTAVTGSPTSFPISVTGGMNSFFFGPRSVAAGTEPLDYTPGAAVSATIDNVLAVPTWMLGSVLLVGLSIVGLRHAARRTAVLLAALPLVFVGGYTFWWANALTQPGALDGIGPHYLMPAVIGLSGLGAIGFSHLVDRVQERRPASARTAVGVLGVVLVLATLPWLPAKHRDKARQNERYDAWALAVDELPADGRLLVLIDDESPEYLGADIPFLLNLDGEDARVVYANPVGPDVVELAATRERTVWVLSPSLRAGDDFFAPSVEAAEVDLVAGSCLRVDYVAHVPPDASSASGYVSVGASRLTDDPLEAPGRTDGQRQSVELTADRLGGDGSEGSLVVGIEVDRASHGGTEAPPPERFETRFAFDLRGDTIRAVLPGTPFHRFDFFGQVWVRERVDSVMADVTVRACDQA